MPGLRLPKSLSNSPKFLLRFAVLHGNTVLLPFHYSKTLGYRKSGNCADCLRTVPQISVI